MPVLPTDDAPHWHRYAGGVGWRQLDDGRIRLEGGVHHTSEDLRPLVVTDADGCIRTRGEPLTMRRLIADYGDLISCAAETFGVDAPTICAMIGIEALKLRGSVSFDPFSLRDEDGEHFRDIESRPGRVSAGLMQTLLRTARQMADKHNLTTSFAGTVDRLELGHLCVPEISIYLGTAYLADRDEACCCEGDPILLVGAYNAGGLYRTNRNPWRIRTHQADRIPKFAAYYNDVLEVLNV